jgi:hypothetical protein
VRTAARDGKILASKAETVRYEQLMDLQLRGAISDLVCQPSYTFPTPGGDVLRFATGNYRPLRYVADFRYRNAAGAIVVEDVKGVLTPDANIKIALMKALNGIEVQLIGYRWSKKPKRVIARKAAKAAKPVVRFGLPE